MEHVSLSIAFLTIVALVIISKFLNNKLSIPLSMSFISISYCIYMIAPNLLNLKATENFDQILFFLIPIIISIDAFHLKWDYIKNYYPSIIYLAVFSVGISIALGSSLYFLEILGPGMTIGMYVALFSIVMATDAISVSSIFKDFNVPHNIKVLTEGESLINDATAMTAFFFIGLPWISAGTFDLSTIPFVTIKVFSISMIIGFIIGYLSFVLMKLTTDDKDETLITISVAYASFVLAEIVHVSGLLSLIVAVVLFKTLIDKELKEEKIILNKEKENLPAVKRFRLFQKETTTKVKHENTLMNLENYSYLATALVFVSFSSLINIEQLIKYWKEIIIMFIATTVIRALVMAKFLFIGKKMKAIDYVGFNGWVILTLAGMKGALSIIMVHALPKDFLFKEMFEAVTVGLILLSIFVYGITLVIYMKKQDQKNVN